MHGLFRVRGFTQDDAHIFCLPDQIRAEIVGVLNLVEETLSMYGFTKYEINLSTRPEKSVGAVQGGVGGWGAGWGGVGGWVGGWVGSILPRPYKCHWAAPSLVYLHVQGHAHTCTLTISLSPSAHDCQPACCPPITLGPIAHHLLFRLAMCCPALPCPALPCPALPHLPHLPRPAPPALPCLTCW